MSEETSREEQSTKKDTNKGAKAEMSFLDHLEALRWHIIKSSLAIVIFATLVYIYSSFVWDSIIFPPMKHEFWTSQMLIRLSNFLGMHSKGLNVTFPSSHNDEMAYVLKLIFKVCQT